MAILGDIEVQIASKTTGKAFHEYDQPNSIPSAHGLSIEKFIQAEVGLDFHVELFVKPSFKFHRASGLKLSVESDGGRVRLCTYWTKLELLEKQREEEPLLSDYMTHREGTQWYRTKFQFGSLGINEDFKQEKEALDIQAKNLGVINVSVVRVKRRKRSVPKIRGSLYNPNIAQNVAKELVKQRHISHAMKAGEKTPIRTPEPLVYAHPKLPGENGRSYHFSFRYRSQMDLELLGCNPHDEELGPLVSGARSTNHDVGAELPSELANPRRDPIEFEEQTCANEDENPTVAKRRESGQRRGVTASEQPRQSSVEDLSPTRMTNEPTIVEEGQSSRGLEELRTRVEALENKNSQLLQENQVLHMENTALKQKNEQIVASLQSLMGNMTNTSTPSTSAILAGPSNASTSSTKISIKRERIKEKGHAECSGMSATTRNRPVKRIKTVDLTDD